MGFSSRAGRRCSSVTFFGLSMTEKTRGRSEGEENIGVFPVTGWSRPSDACFSHTRMRVGARRWALTEPERGVGL